MGQAKLRGSKDQRIEQSLTRQEQEAVEREVSRKAREELARQAEAARIAALPPKQQAEERFSRNHKRVALAGTRSILISALIASSVGATMATARPFKRPTDFGPDIKPE